MGYRLQWYQTREYNFFLGGGGGGGVGFSVCSHVYLLDYMSELAQIWRQDTDTIKKYFNASAVRAVCV